MSSLTAAFAPTMERAPLRVILASAIGSALEWYDFFLYGTAAALVFGEAFFPEFDPLVGVLLSFASFGVGFVARPFGGLVFGYLGDRHGRKPVLIATLLLVGIGTVLIGCLPTYAMIGVWAPILLVLLRLVQGFGAGAEYGGAVILLVEYAPPGHRGLWGGFAPLGVAIGNLLAAGAFAVVSKLPREQFMSWGWRLPFLLSIILVLVGLYIRYRVMETPVFREAVARRAVVARENPVVESIRRQPRNFFVLLGARVAENGLGYLFPVFGLAYVTTALGVNKSAALNALIVAYVIELITIPVFSRSLGPGGPPAGLSVWRIVRHRARRPVLPDGRHPALAMDHAGLRAVARRRHRCDVRTAGRVFRRAVRADAPLLRVRLRARARVRPRRRAGSVRGHGARCLGRRLVVAGRALYRAAVRRDRVCSVVRTGDLSRRHQHGRERAGAQDLRRLRSHLCSRTCFKSTRIFRFWLRSAKKGCLRDKQIFCR